jgi:hypothetical protein
LSIPGLAPRSRSAWRALNAKPLPTSGGEEMVEEVL